jgi:hypothetical protein
MTTAAAPPRNATAFRTATKQETSSGAERGKGSTAPPQGVGSRPHASRTTLERWTSPIGTAQRPASQTQTCGATTARTTQGEVRGPCVDGAERLPAGWAVRGQHGAREPLPPWVQSANGRGRGNTSKQGRGLGSESCQKRAKVARDVVESGLWADALAARRRGHPGNPPALVRLFSDRSELLLGRCSNSIPLIVACMNR